MIAVRRLLLLAVFGVLALALSTGAADARIDASGSHATGSESVPAAHRRAGEARVRPDALICMGCPSAARIRYEFELATSKSFTESSIVWSNANDEFVEPTDHDHAPPRRRRRPSRRQPPSWRSSTRTCARRRSPSISRCPGSPARPTPSTHMSARSRTRAHLLERTLRLQHPLVEHPEGPQEPASGLVRWSPVDGATAYQVWLFGAKTTFMTTTNVADARDLYTFHRTNPFFTGSIRFRVRAQRTLYGEVVSGLPATTWGPWSPVYTDVQPPLSLGTLGDVATVSDVQSNSSPGPAHALMPRLRFSAATAAARLDIIGAPGRAVPRLRRNG